MEQCILVVLAGTFVVSTVPPEAVLVRLTEQLSRTKSVLSRSETINTVTSVLPRSISTPFTVPISGGDWIAPWCNATIQTECVWNGGSYRVDYLDPNGSNVGEFELYQPSFLCTISVRNWTRDGDGWCVLLSADGDDIAEIGIFGDVITTGSYLVNQQVLDDTRFGLEPVDVVCGLVPLGRYHVWAGNGDVAQCRLTIVAPETPITVAPILVNNISLSIGTTFIAFFIRLVPQTSIPTHIVVEYDDTYNNTTKRFVWSGASVVPTLQAGVLGIIYRTFINPVPPNTLYRIRAAIANPSGTPVTPFSLDVVQKTLPTIQARPLPPLVTYINDTDDVLVRLNLGVREYGVTINTTFIIIRDVADSFDDEVIQTMNCTGVCPDGIIVPSQLVNLHTVLFVKTIVYNERGVSPESGASTIVAPPGFVNHSDRLTTGDIIGTSIGGVCLVVLIVLVVVMVRRRRIQARFITLVRPVPDPRIEMDRDQFVLLEKIGEGASSTVFRSMHNDQGRSVSVAIKRIRNGVDPVQISGFFNEIATLAQLHHDNVVGLIGAVTQTDPVIMIMEYCSLGALNDHVKAHTETIDELWRWAGQMCRAVGYIHTNNVIHRDLACRNFLLNEHRNIKLCDLGMSKRLDFVVDYYQHNEVSVAVRWAAPQCLSKGVFNRGTDTWALCVSLRELYTRGEAPYVDLIESRAVYDAIIGGRRLDAPDIMPAVLRRCLVHVWSQHALDDITTEPIIQLFENEPLNVLVIEI